MRSLCSPIQIAVWAPQQCLVPSFTYRLKIGGEGRQGYLEAPGLSSLHRYYSMGGGTSLLLPVLGGYLSGGGFLHFEDRSRKVSVYGSDLLCM